MSRTLTLEDIDLAMAKSLKFRNSTVFISSSGSGITITGNWAVSAGDKGDHSDWKERENKREAEKVASKELQEKYREEFEKLKAAHLIAITLKDE